ncbi:hypothetical protein BASA81_008000 [Batrachochytrium salamandrivorans]|nr:hypothetical protein BASA81_008000 [Batrachochytrium salamandrivorans]
MRIFLTFLLCAGLMGVRGEDDSSYLKVMVPSLVSRYFSELGPSKTNLIPHSQALFGAPRYGGDKRIVGQVFYLTPGREVDGCSFELTDEVKESKQPKIFLVDRGNCDFVDKVKLSQQLGAQAVIIADNVCQCSATESWPREETVGRTKKLLKECDRLGAAARQSGRIAGSCETTLPYMADDGSGADVVIPSFLISFLDAQVLKDCISNEGDTISRMQCNDDQKVIVSLEWDLSQLTTVEWSLWSSSDSEGVFKKAFAPLVSTLQDKTKFSPRYFIWDGKNWGCDEGSVCGDQCAPGGYYCNPSPIHAFMDNVTGRGVVEENLRQLCVWQQSKQSGKPQLWWDYVAKFAADCHPSKVVSSELFNAKCSESVHDKIPGLSYLVTSKCVDDSWVKAPFNPLLDQELKDREQLKILQLPTAVVNGQLLRGGVTPNSVLGSICAGYVPGSAPRVCDCINSMTSADSIETCLNSSCSAGQIFCQKDRLCYDQNKFDELCNPACPVGTQFCQSLSSCVNKRDPNACPLCTSEKPVYCTASKSCVANGIACVPVDGGTSVFQVVVITLAVVFAALAIGFRFWKRQQARLHEDVRAILESYRALDHESGTDIGDVQSAVPATSKRNGAYSQVSTDTTATII